MKRWTVLIVVMVAALAAIVVSERRKAEAPVSPTAVLTVAADVQREVSRVPAAVTRISDAEEIQIGDAMAARRLMWHANDPADAEAVVVEAYVQKVGMHVAARAERKLPYRFHYVAEPYFVNAYALPGGHVFIGQGLLVAPDLGVFVEEFPEEVLVPGRKENVLPRFLSHRYVYQSGIWMWSRVVSLLLCDREIT